MVGRKIRRNNRRGERPPPIAGKTASFFLVDVNAVDDVLVGGVGDCFVIDDIGHAGGFEQIGDLLGDACAGDERRPRTTERAGIVSEASARVWSGGHRTGAWGGGNSGCNLAGQGRSYW
jgi:hypothetical protein